MTEKKEVLFIDDEKHIRRANRQTLELADLDVICRDSAEKGLEQVNREWSGIIVCDILIWAGCNFSRRFKK